MMDGLTDTQIHFIETFIVMPKHFGKKKARKRREVATREFRSFNVNHDAVEDRIRQITDPGIKSDLLADLAHAEEIIEANPKKLDFEGGHAHLVSVNELTKLRLKQQDAKERMTAAQGRMQDLNNQRQAGKATDTGLDNQADIDLVWGFAQDKYISGMEKDAIGDLDSAVKALDRLGALIEQSETVKPFELRSDALEAVMEGAQEGLKAAVLDARRDLSEISNAYLQLEDRAKRAFTAQAVPDDIEALLRTVDARLDAAADGTPDTLPGLATAARQALTAATVATDKRIGEKMVWVQKRQLFLRSWDMITGHTHKDQAVYVKPKFDLIEAAYTAAEAKADTGDFAGAATDLIPLIPRAASLVELADDYGRFLAMETEREAMIAAMPPVAAHDKIAEVKAANEAARALLAQAKTARDGEDMTLAATKLEQIPAAVDRFNKVKAAYDKFMSKHKEFTTVRAQFETKSDAVKNCVRAELDQMDRVANEALVTATAGDLGNATSKMSAMTGFLIAVKKKIDIIADFMVERPLFDARLQATALRDGPNGRIAIEDYYQRLLADQQRVADYSDGVDTEYGLALAAATALKAQHDDKMALADKGKKYLRLREKLTTEIARLENGAAGGEQAAESIAVTETAMANAVAAARADDWDGAIYLLRDARSELKQGTRAAEIASEIDGMQDADALDNIASDFDAALGEFRKAAAHIDGLDKDGVFTTLLTAAEQTADSGRSFLPADPGSARARIEAGIAACKEVGKKLTQLESCKDQIDVLKPDYETLKSLNLDKVLDAELADIKARFKTVAGMMKPKVLDLPGAMAELTAIGEKLNTGFTLEALYKNRCKPAQARMKALVKRLEHKKVAPGLDTEIARIKGIQAAMQTALDARDFATLRNKIDEGWDLKKPYEELAQAYVWATNSYDTHYTKTGIKTVQNAAVDGQLSRIRDTIAGVDRLMEQHAYMSAHFQIEKSSYLIYRALKAIADFPAYETAMTAAEVAMQDLLDRDDAGLGPAHDQITALKARFDAARKDATMDQFNAAARKLDGFVEACEEVAEKVDHFELFVAARDTALAELGKISAVDTAGIAPLFARLEGKRDNALAKAAAFDFDMAITLFEELVSDCATAATTLDGQKVFGEIMDKIAEISDGDRDDLRMSIEAAQATLKQLRSNPTAMYFKTAMDAALAKLQQSSLKLDEDFDLSRDLLGEVLEDCQAFSVQMGQIDQLCDAAQLARDLGANLAAHPHYGQERTATEAALSRMESAMANVRRDPDTRAASDAIVETIISDLRALRTMLDAHAKYAAERGMIRFELNNKLEKHKDRHMAKPDIVKAHEALDEAEVQATARDYPKAMDELKHAKGRIPAGLLRIKLQANEVPEPEDIRAFLGDKDSTKLLDEVIKGLEPDIQRKVVAVAFKERFGCDLSMMTGQYVDDGTGKMVKQLTPDNDMDRDAPNIRRFYDLMAALPDSDTLDNDSFLIFEHAGGEQTGSAYNFVNKTVKMHEGEAKTTAIYSVSSELELGGQDDLYKAKDGEAVSFFSWNTLHEVAHAVDDKTGFMAGHDGEDNDTYGGWKKYRSNVDEIARAVAGEFDFNSTYVAEYMIKGKGSKPPVPEPDNCDAEEWARRRRDCEIWVDRARSTEKPWKTKVTADACTIGARVYHESQPGDWVSYMASARAKGVTGYQFRAPAEWFSELYAAHHSDKLKDGHPAKVWLETL